MRHGSYRTPINALKSGDIGFVHSWDINRPSTGQVHARCSVAGRCVASTARIRRTWKMRDGKPSTGDDQKIDRYADLFAEPPGGTASLSREASR